MSMNYVVFIPERFNIKNCVDYMATKNQLKYYNNYRDDNYDDDGYDELGTEPLDEYKECIVDTFGDLVHYASLDMFDYDENVYREIVNIILTNNFNIVNTETDEEYGNMVNINTKETREKLSRLEINTFNYEK